jgi:hypothetical protein
MPGAGRTKKTLLVVIASLAGVAFFSTLVWGYIVGWSVDPNPGDRALGIGGDDFARVYGSPELADGTTTVTRTRYLDTSYEVSVEYTHQDFEVSTVFSVELRPSDAREVFTGIALTSNLVEVAADVELQDRDDLFDWGDQSSSQVMLADGQPIGHLIHARQGRALFSITLAGLLVDDPQEMKALLQPVLDAAEQHG